MGIFYEHTPQLALRLIKCPICGIIIGNEFDNIPKGELCLRCNAKK